MIVRAVIPAELLDEVWEKSSTRLLLLHEERGQAWIRVVDPNQAGLALIKNLDRAACEFQDEPAEAAACTRAILARRLTERLNRPLGLEAEIADELLREGVGFTHLTKQLQALVDQALLRRVRADFNEGSVLCAGPGLRFWLSEPVDLEAAQAGSQDCHPTSVTDPAGQREGASQPGRGSAPETAGLPEAATSTEATGQPVTAHHESAETDRSDAKGQEKLKKSKDSDLLQLLDADAKQFQPDVLYVVTNINLGSGGLLGAFVHRPRSSPQVKATVVLAQVVSFMVAMRPKLRLASPPARQSFSGQISLQELIDEGVCAQRVSKGALSQLSTRLTRCLVEVMAGTARVSADQLYLQLGTPTGVEIMPYTNLKRSLVATD